MGRDRGRLAGNASPMLGLVGVRADSRVPALLRQKMPFRMKFIIRASNTFEMVSKRGADGVRGDRMSSLRTPAHAVWFACSLNCYALLYIVALEVMSSVVFIGPLALQLIQTFTDTQTPSP